MAKGKLYVEKRKHKRVEKHYDVTYKLMPKDMQTSHKTQKGRTVDLSMGGARIEGEVIGSKNDMIRIELAVEKGKNPVTVLAEIKWIKKDSFGLSFVALKEDEAMTISEILD